jgi:hypothetical protein
MGNSGFDHGSKFIYSGMAMQRRANGDLLPNLKMFFNSTAEENLKI